MNSPVGSGTPFGHRAWRGFAAIEPNIASDFAGGKDRIRNNIRRWPLTTRLPPSRQAGVANAAPHDHAVAGSHQSNTHRISSGALKYERREYESYSFTIPNRSQNARSSAGDAWLLELLEKTHVIFK